MHLDAGAVELVLDRGPAGDLQRGRGRRSRRGQHGQNRAPDPQAHRLEVAFVSGECDAGGLAEVAREHGRAPDDGRRAVGGPRDGIEEHAREGAGAQFAEHRAGEEVPLRGRGARGEVAEDPAAHRRGAGARCRRQRVQRLVDLADGQRRAVGVGDVEGGDATPPDPQPALAGRREQQAHDGGDLGRVRAREQFGEGIDLREPRRGGPDPVGGGDELCEHHGGILAPVSDIRLAGAGALSARGRQACASPGRPRTLRGSHRCRTVRPVRRSRCRRVPQREPLVADAGDELLAREERRRRAAGSGGCGIGRRLHDLVIGKTRENRRRPRPRRRS